MKFFKCVSVSSVFVSDILYDYDLKLVPVERIDRIAKKTYGVLNFEI